jgi:hypothetical protein
MAKPVMDQIDPTTYNPSPVEALLQAELNKIRNKSVCYLFADSMIGKLESAAYDNEYSLLFDGSAHYLSRTPGSAASSRRKGFLCIRGLHLASRFGDTDPHPYMYEGYFDANNRTSISISGDRIYFTHITSGNAYSHYTNALRRDNVKKGTLYVEWDTTQATAASRVRIWWNGVEQVLSNGGLGAIPQNSDLFLNHTVSQFIGRNGAGGSYYFSGFMNEIISGDGITVGNPDQHGDIDTLTEQWVEKVYSGSYGTNGFRLRWRDATSTTTLGYDDSGNGNNWTLNSMATTDRLTDSVANCHAIWNALIHTAAVAGDAVGAIGEGGLSFTSTAGVQRGCLSTLTIKSKIHCEFVGGDNSNDVNQWIGIFRTPEYKTFAYAANGQYFNGSTWGAYGSSYANGDTITVEFDPDTLTLEFFKNGVSQGQKTVDAGEYVIAGACYYASGSSGWTANFGQKAFSDTPTTGFDGLSTSKMPTPPVRKASLGFCSQVWTGTGGARTLSGFPFQPDFAWGKSRGSTLHHYVADSVRGANLNLFPNLTTAEHNVTSSGVFTDGGWGAQTSDGYTIVSGTATANNLNQSSVSYIGWFWKRAAQFGFDIVAYVGNATNRTVSHGVGKALDMLVVKNRSSDGTQWCMWNRNVADKVGAAYVIFLESTGAAASFANVFNSTAPTSSVFSVGTNGSSNGNTNDMIAYCWAGIDGYSWFGSWTGNASTNGTFVYMGLKPVFDYSKNVVTAGTSHSVTDATRDTYNPRTRRLLTDSSAAEATDVLVDFLAGGKKFRNTINNTAVLHIGMAFGDPVKTAMAA